MGIKRLPNLEDYWSQDFLLGCPELVSSWPYRQFRALLSYLHFNDNNTFIPRGQPGHDRLHKLRPLLDMVAERCKSVYKPERELSLDEAMVGFKGRSSLKQYLPLKPTKRGYKIWCVCESKSGYLLNFDVYTGKSDNSSTTRLGATVVKHLSTSYHNMGHVLFVDNYFSDVQLAKDLLSCDTYVCATTRIDRKGFPNEIKKVKLDRRGDYRSVIVDHKVQAVVWKDKKNVHFLNTFYDFDEETEVKRKLHDGSTTNVCCPTCVKGYNKYMGGVDLCDQKRKLFSCSRKSIRWYMRLFWFLIDVCVVNAYIMEQLSPHHCKRSQKDFRLDLANVYIRLENTRKRPGRPRSLPIPVRLTDRHFSEKVSGSRRRCCVCAKRYHLEKRTCYQCSICSVALCPGTCFTIYHTQEKFW